MIARIFGHYETGSLIDEDAVYYIKGYTADGELVSTWVTEALGNQDCMCVDSRGNVYVIDNTHHNLIKRNKSGVIVLTRDNLVYATAVVAGADNYLYCFDESETAYVVLKLNLDTLETESEMNLPFKAYWGLVLDSDGYIYVANDTDDYIEKWDFGTETRLAYHAISGHQAYLTSLGLVRELIAGIDLFTPYYVWTIPKSLDENPTDWDITASIDKPNGATSIDDDFLFMGHASSPDIPEYPGLFQYSRIMISRYNADNTLVWEVELLPWLGTCFGCVASYAFEVVEEYDYPLAPVVFPAKKRGTTLKMDCINFEESMSDVCLVVNHNTRVTREYLQTTYVGTTYSESSNLRFILPSQQLVKLSSKDLTAKDFDAIINNFISNILDMFILINQNNTLVKQWLDDYAPEEEGHDFTDVKMRPIIVGKDLSKTMDELFKGIIDNVTILNDNLEVLKERF